jgi:hypothetical protein
MGGQRRVDLSATLCEADAGDQGDDCGEERGGRGENEKPEIASAINHFSWLALDFCLPERENMPQFSSFLSGPDPSGIVAAYGRCVTKDPRPAEHYLGQCGGGVGVNTVKMSNATQPLPLSTF